MASKYDPNKFNPNDPSTWPTTVDKIAESSVLRDMEIVFRPGMMEIESIKTDPNNPQDVQDALTFVRELRELRTTPGNAVHSLLTIAAERKAADAALVSGDVNVPQPAQTDLARAVTSTLTNDVGGITIEEMAKRFATRRRSDLTEKTLYEYGNYHQKFIQWVHKRKGRKNVPIRLIDRNDMADYIEDLLAEKLEPSTIQQKYFAAITGLFKLARSTGDIPFGYLPTEGHSIFPKRAKRKAEKNSYKPFTDADLKVIFDPENYLKMEKPCDFWLPLIALFTGGRISELCQLATTDIQLHGDIWAISINDEDGKNLKNAAAERLIPIHPQLIALGFLDYVEDAKQYGSRLFPYLNADRFNGFSKTPSDRWGRYLDRISITDPQKVFHSFRSTSNNCLKSNGVSEESRCQFIGHEHDTVNSKTYSDPHKLPFLLEHVASKLTYPNLDLDRLLYPRDKLKGELAKLCTNADKFRRHRVAKQARKKLVENIKK